MRKQLCNLIPTYFQEMNFNENSRKLIFAIPEKCWKKYFFGEFASVLIWKILIGTILQEENA